MSDEGKDYKNNIIVNIEKQFKEIDTRGAWPLFYQHIRNESNNYDYSYEASKKPENKNLNRYRDVNPYDHSRVVLRRGASDQDKQRSDYINANLIRMPSAHRQYILAQGPLPNTTDHFWLMIWEQNCKAVIMLNRIIEKNQIKCHSYWPTGGAANTEKVLLSVKLKVEFVSETNMSYYSTRVLRLTDLESGESRHVHHFHYTTWPDFGVPQSPLAFLHFLMQVRQSGALDENVGPPVVHCSAGIGRSGTFCLVDTCLVLMQEGHCAVNVRDVLMEMRRHRMGLIQTPDQLRFSYLSILEGAKRLLTADGEINLELFNANHMLNEDDDDEAPPPRPPPRGDSLIARAAQQILNNANHVGENSSVVPPLVLPELPPDRPLPCEPDNKSLQKNENSDEDDEDEEEEEDEQTQSPLREGSNTESDASSLRRRKREERRERTTEQVREIKRKQREAEEWQELKRSILQPMNIGVGMLVLGGSILLYYRFFG